MSSDKRLARPAALPGLLLAALLTGCTANQILPTAAASAANQTNPTSGTPTTPTTPVVVPPAPVYHSYGDSITAGATLSSPSLAYPSLIAQAKGFTLANYAVDGAQACDVPTTQIFPNSDNPSAASLPIYTLMIGTNDQDNRGVGDYLPVFNLCHQATIAWLALPADFKVLATAAGVTTTGTGAIETANNWNDWVSTAPGASIAFPITLLSPGAIYIWPRIADGDPGAFTYAVDGAIAGTFTTATKPFMTTASGTNNSLGFLRIPGIAAGRHAVTLTQTSSSGTMRVVAVGSPQAASETLTTVIVSDPPIEELNSTAQCNSAPAVCSAYVTDIQTTVQIFASDGLNVRFIDTHLYMLGTPAEMNDTLHPNPLGQSELATALETVLP